ncbi:ABC transporter permease [Nocardioides litoris]|uniref:ABC transporter permease n=1 Tax=Nocardioides litoris TaxID=1926648 RepID=UPI00111E0AD0|nr:ABC transporter permease [Nocardioides litoris]
MTSAGTEALEARSDINPSTEPPAPKDIAGRSPTRIALARLAKDKVAVVCGLVLLLLVLAGLFAPVICNALNIYKDYSPGAPRASDVLDFDSYPLVGPPYYPFTWDHPLGVEPNTGYDNLALLLYGLRTSLFIAVLATVVSTVVGVTLGLVAGYAKGWVDSLLSFFIDFMLSFPFILGALALAPIITTRFGGNSETLGRAEFLSLVGVLVLFGWMGLARLVRGQVLSLREREFVQAAQVIGVPTRRILFKELLPNLVAPIVVSLSLALPAYVAAEAGLSFLGIGLSEGTSLGKTIASARGYYDTYPLYLWVPVGTIMVLVIALNLLGDSVRDAFDPKTRR